MWWGWGGCGCGGVVSWSLWWWCVVVRVLNCCLWCGGVVWCYVLAFLRLFCRFCLCWVVVVLMVAQWGANHSYIYMYCVGVCGLPILFLYVFKHTFCGCVCWFSPIFLWCMSNKIQKFFIERCKLLKVREKKFSFSLLFLLFVLFLFVCCTAYKQTLLFTF